MRIILKVIMISMVINISRIVLSINNIYFIGIIMRIMIRITMRNKLKIMMGIMKRILMQIMLRIILKIFMRNMLRTRPRYSVPISGV